MRRPRIGTSARTVETADAALRAFVSACGRPVTRRRPARRAGRRPRVSSPLGACPAANGLPPKPKPPGRSDSTRAPAFVPIRPPGDRFASARHGAARRPQRDAPRHAVPRCADRSHPPAGRRSDKAPASTHCRTGRRAARRLTPARRQVPRASMRSRGTSGGGGVEGGSSCRLVGCLRRCDLRVGARRLRPRRLRVHFHRRALHVPFEHEIERAEGLLDALVDRFALEDRRLAQHVVGRPRLSRPGGRCPAASARSRRCPVAPECLSKPLCPAGLPPSLIFAWPGDRSSSSCAMRTSPGAILKKRTSAATDLPREVSCKSSARAARPARQRD